MPSVSAGYPTLSADADFPGANGVEFERCGPDRLRFQMVKHASPACLWWQFRAQVPVGRRVTFELANPADTLCGPRGWSVVQPVFSYDRERWQRIPARDCRLDPATGRFVFSGSFRKPVVYFAQAYPYHFAELHRLRDDLRRSPLFRERLAGRTAGGRPYPLWEITPEGKTKPGSRPRLGIFLTARLHAGESHGSYALEGMLREIVFGKNPAMQWLRRHAAVLIAPFVDLDGVAEGMFGKDRAPIDFNRDWSADPVRPEIRRLQAEVDAWSRRVRYAAHFDFHCPCLPNVPHIYGAAPGMATPRLKAAEREFALDLERRSPHGAKMFLRDWSHPGYQGPTAEVVCSRYQTARYGVLGMTPEIAYHPTRRSARDDAQLGPVIELPAIAKLGAAHAQALAALLQNHYEEIFAHARPFFDPAEAPPVGPVIAREDSPFRAWGLLGGDPAQFSERLSQKVSKTPAPSLVIQARPGPAPFLVSPQLPLAAGLVFRARATAAKALKKGAAPRGLVVHVFYYDRHGARFGRLFGSEMRELPLTADWQTFRPQRPPPRGAVTARLALRCELDRGRAQLVFP